MKALLGLYTALVLFFLYLPIGVMAFFSLNAGEQVVVWRGATLDWYRKAFENHEAATALGHSLAVGCAATALATVLGTAAAVASVRLDFPGKRFFSTLLAAPIVIPDVLMGLSFLVFFIALGIDLGRGTVIAAHTTFCLSYVAVVVAARLHGLDRSAELAAQDLGATPLGAFFRVTLPAIAPAVGAGALLAFALSFDDVVVTYFTSGERVTTLPVYLYSRVRFKFTPEVNAWSILILVVSLGLLAAALRLHRPALGEDAS